jgi:hypothetical protein
MPRSPAKTLLPLRLTAEVTVRSVADMARVIMAETDAQVTKKELPTAAAVDDFRISCDALNFWRLCRRFQEELGPNPMDDAHTDLFKRVARAICVRRNYEIDDFVSAQEATFDRVRLPWGFTSLQLAMSRAKRRPVKLLHPDLADAELPALIAATALELIRLEPKGDTIILPIEAMRAQLKQRKIVVAGAVTRLMKGGLLECVNPADHRKRHARTFVFTGQRGIHYELLYDEEVVGADAAS